ncbi:methyltransferase [Methanopyrus sp.]
MELKYRTPAGVDRLYLPRCAFPRSSRDAWRKKEQIEAMMTLLSSKLRPGDAVVDCGCGRGGFTTALAISSPSCDVLGFDVREFDAWAKLRHYVESVGLDNLEFEVNDLHEVARDGLPYDPDVVVGLHLCGTLTDRLLELAVDSDARVVLVVPCCYGRASPRVIVEELGVDESVERVREVLKGAEGCTEYQLEACRMRGRFLEEHGYRVRVGVAFPEEVSGRRAFLMGIT